MVIGLIPDPESIRLPFKNIPSLFFLNFTLRNSRT